MPSLTDSRRAGGAPVIVPDPQPAAWRRDLAEAFRDPAELCRVLGLDERLAAEAAGSTAGFPFLVPRGFAARMRRGDPTDPLLAQVLPRAAETQPAAGYSADPLAEVAAVAAPGLVHKYEGRALVLVTGGCAVNCRYCFRREFPYAASGATRRGVLAALEAVATRCSRTTTTWPRSWSGSMPSRSCGGCGSTRGCPSCCQAAWTGA